MAFDPDAFRPEKSYRDALLLFSHELFHAWNVKRIRPEAFGPFDYGREVYTEDLWALEGFTSYYEALLLVRAGLLTEAQAFEEWMRHWKAHLETPGRLVQSAETASFDAWIRFYRPDENSVNVAESYYRRGALLGLALDLTLRRATGGVAASTTSFRRLFRTYAAKGRGYPPGAFEDAAARVARSPAGDARLLRPLRARHRDAGSRAAPRGRGPEAARGARDRGGRDGRDGPAPQGRLRLEDEGRGRAARRGGGPRGRAGRARGRERGRRARGPRRAPRGRGADRPAREGTQAGERGRRSTVFRRDVLETHRVRLGGRRASVWKIDALARCARPAPGA